MPVPTFEPLAPAKAVDDGKFVQVQIGTNGIPIYVPAAVDVSGLATTADLAGETADRLAASKIGRIKGAYRDVAKAMEAPGIIPTVTIGTGVPATPTSQIPNAIQLVNPLDPNGLEDGTPFRYIGAYNIAYGTSGLDLNNVRPRSLTGSITGAPYSVRFSLSHATQLEFITKMINGTPSFRLSIDGQLVTEGEYYLTGPSLGTLFGVMFSGLDTGPHTYSIEFSNAMWFGGVYASPNAALWKTPKPALRAVLLSDSTGGGANASTSDPAAGATSIGVWWSRLCNLMGWSDTYNASIGGSGMIELGQGVKFIDRVSTDVTPLAADIIVISGSRNDHVDSKSAIRTAADTLYATVKAQNPQAYIIAVGPWTGVSRSQAYTDNNDAVRDAALAAGIPFVDMYTGFVYDSSGNVLIADHEWITGTGWYSNPVGAHVYQRNSFDGGGGVSGQVITPINSVGPNLDGFATVLGSPIFSTTHAAAGQLAMKAPATNDGATHLVSYATPYTTTFVRFYYWTGSGAPPVDTKIFSSQSGLPNGNMHRIVHNANGKLSCNVNGSTGASSAAAVPANTWIRIEVQLVVNGTQASMVLRYYNSPESVTITDTLTPTAAADLSTSLSKVNFGLGAAGLWAVEIDEIEANNDTWPGPISTAVYQKSGSSDWAVGPDAVHPTQAGHLYWSRRANSAFRTIIDKQAVLDA